MKSKKLSSITASVFALAVLVTACGGAADNGTSGVAAGGEGADAPPPEPPTGVAEFRDAEPGSGEGLEIGFTQLNLAQGFPQDVQESVEAQIERSGATLATCDSKGDAAQALDCAKQFAVKDVDGLITFQADTNAAPRICDAGPDVPVMAVDIGQDPCETSFVGAANSYAGELIGYNVGLHFLNEFECEYDAFISLESEAVGEVNELRMGGIRDGFESVCGEIHDLHKLDTGAGGQTDEARRQVTDTLTALPGAEKIILTGINEDVIIGGLAAARTQNRQDDLFLGVQNLNPDNCVIYESKNWIGSVAYFPERYGELLVPYLIDAIKGEEIPEQLLVPHEFVTPETMSEFYPEASC